MPKEEKVLSPKERIEEAQKAIQQVKYNDDEKQYRSYLIDRLTTARNQRDCPHPEFDGQTYLEYYETNKKAAQSFVRPKDNRSDTRIVTGTTEEKTGTLLSAILNFNLDPNIEAFDKNNLFIAGLGEDMEDMVKKSRELENYDLSRLLIYKEVLDQGTCFVEETWIEEQKIKKELKKKDLDWSEGVKVDKIKWDSKFEKIQGRCQVNLIPGTQVYLGNVREFYIDKQPYLFTVEVKTYNQAESEYRNWDRWQYVPRQIQRVQPAEGTIYDDFSLQDLQQNMVEIIKYQDKWTNEYMIMINGVMMLPVGFPLTAISPSSEYTLAKGDAYPISKYFAYSRSIPAKTKIDQAVLDESLRLMIFLTQQQAKPPMADNTNSGVSSEIFLPASIVPGINPDKLKAIIDAKGVQPGFFNMFELLKRIVDEKTVSPVFSGDESKGGKTTATEIVQRQKQSMMKMGSVLYGMINLEKQITNLRVPNLCVNWTQKIDEKVDKVKKQIIDIYQTIVVNSTDELGKDIRKVIEFTTDPEKLNKDSVAVMAEEELMGGPSGEFRKVYLNPEMLKTLEYFFYVTINPTEKSSDDVDRVLFSQDVAEGFQLFGPQSFNMDWVKDQWALKKGWDADKALLKQQQQPMGMAAGMPPQGGAPGMSPEGAQMTQGLKTTTKQPSVNTLSK